MTGEYQCTVAEHLTLVISDRTGGALIISQWASGMPSHCNEYLKWLNDAEGSGRVTCLEGRYIGYG